MSGIGAIFSLTGPVASRGEIERMRNALKPLGPDGQRILVRNNVAFVACLQRFTPEDALEQQPLELPGAVILFDGRLDNRDELAGALGIYPAELAYLPDSKLAARAWSKWGNGAFAHMVGAFALIIADLRAGELWCVRDQLGLRSLYYHQSKDHFAVASSPEALLALSWVPRELNEAMVAAALVQRSGNPEESYFRGISRIRVGTCLRLTTSGIRQSEFWEPETLTPVRFRNDEQYVEAFQELLQTAVAASLRSVGTPCSEITGGLDSSSISVIAADMLAGRGEKLDAYCAVPEKSFTKGETQYRYFDETPRVHEIAALNQNLRPHFIAPSKAPLAEQIAELTRVVGEPASVLNGLWGMDILRTARAAGHKVLLSGQMGNDTMSYPGNSLAAELIVSGRWWRLVLEIVHSRVRRERMIRREVILPFVPRAVLKTYANWRRGGAPPWQSFSPINPALAVDTQVDARADRFDRGFDRPPTRDGRLDRIRALRRAEGGADWNARMRAAFGIDIRMPALDRRLVEFCLRIPEDQYLHYGERRWLMRRAMRGRLPAAVLANHKIGSQAADWFPRFRRELPALRQEIQRVARAPRVPRILDAQGILDVIDTWPDQEPPQGSRDADRMAVLLPDGLSAAFFVEAFDRQNVQSAVPNGIAD